MLSPLVSGQVDRHVDLLQVAKETDGFSGSDLKEMCRDAALLCVREYVNSACEEEKYVPLFCVMIAKQQLGRLLVLHTVQLLGLVFWYEWQILAILSNLALTDRKQEVLSWRTATIQPKKPSRLSYSFWPWKQDCLFQGVELELAKTSRRVTLQHCATSLKRW